MKYPKIVERIHTEFMTAGDILLKEAECILAKSLESDIEKGLLLKKLGFSESPEAKASEKILQEKEDALELAHLISSYNQHYPNNKFITPDQVARICDKYNLVCGPVDRYRGFVPKDKLKQISEFILKPEHKEPDKIRVTGFSFPHAQDREIGILKKINPKMIFPCDTMNQRGTLSAYGVEVNVDQYDRISTPELLICAPKKDMNMKGLSKVGAMFAMLVTVQVPDPVVLKPVKGGYLVVAAWGDEASDPIVVNQKLN
jgi:hypothetical protein